MWGMSLSSSLAHRLVTACGKGDFRAAEAAIADGASVNEAGTAPHWGGAVLPLVTALHSQRDDVVVWLLSRGADPNGDRVMCYGVGCGTAASLQLLIDAGGDVNGESGGWPPLFTAVYGRCEPVRVLLAQPSLDPAIIHLGRTVEQYAGDVGKPALVDMIAQEVSNFADGTPILHFMEVLSDFSANALLWLNRGRDERRWYVIVCSAMYLVRYDADHYLWHCGVCAVAVGRATCPRCGSGRRRQCVSAGA